MLRVLSFLRSRFFWRFVIVATLVLIVTSAVTIEVTSRSSFCNNCHIMESYYTSWENDPHGEIGCVNCHIPPGAANYMSAKLNGLGQVVDDWLNRTSTKPSASISDFACTRSGCHVISDLDTSEPGDRPYLFDHGAHLTMNHLGIAVHCTTCHSHVKGDRHFEVNTNTCITCHLTQTVAESRIALDPGLEPHVMLTVAQVTTNHEPAQPDHDKMQRCDTCHVAPQGRFDYRGLTVDHTEYLRYGSDCRSCHRNTTAMPMKVGDSQCLSCHIHGMENALPAEEMHRIHTEGIHKVECFNCHGVTAHGPAAASMSLNEFDCRKCHTAQHAVQRVAYQTAHADDQPTEDRSAISPMFLAHVDCTGCHIEQDHLSVKPMNGASVARAVPAACDRCHRPGFGDQLVPLWQDATRKLYDETLALLPPEDAPGMTAEIEEQVKEARSFLELVRVDGSWGVHNPKYSEQLINQARQGLLAVRDELAATGDSP